MRINTNRIKKRKGKPTGLTKKLMVHGFVCPENGCTLSAEISRGMPIRSEEGQDVGRVAAVLLDSESRQATHVLLGRLPERRGYWLVAVDLICEVRGGTVQLRIPVEVVEALPRWQSNE